MNNTTLEKISAELQSALRGQRFGKIFPLAKQELAIDFRLHDSRYLFISIVPNAPRIYLIRRRLKDLEKQSLNPTPFVLFLRKRLSGAALQSIEKIENERVLKFSFLNYTEIGEAENYTLVVQLTGRSSNLFLLDAKDFILDSMRENSGTGQEIGNRYAPPVRDAETRARRAPDAEIFPQSDFATLSEALDEFYQTREAEKRFQAKAQTAQNKLKQEIARREKLVKNLNQDLKNHGDAEQWKRFGDLLLANLATARRSSGKVLVTDFYDENLPDIEIEVDENQSITEAAEKFFRRYAKARNAREEISRRLAVLQSEISRLKAQNEELQQAIFEIDENFLDNFSGAKAAKSGKTKEKNQERFSGARSYLSSDGFEILVGKGARDNDFLTFRVAKSQDLWLHAADYPGSHVVVKNPNRKEIPQKTLIEAAQIAAFFSQARTEAKAAVHYTQKKFVFKPKGAVAGLVNLASFKTILVEPKIIEK